MARLGRHYLLFHRRHQPAVSEPLVLDGFESFEFSQYFPFHFNVLVGRDSHFLFGFIDSPPRRKGRMTARQKLRRVELEDRLGRPDPRAVEKAVAELLRLTVPEPRPITLHTEVQTAALGTNREHRLKYAFWGPGLRGKMRNGAFAGRPRLRLTTIFEPQP